MVKKSIIFLICSISWLNAQFFVQQTYFYKIQQENVEAKNINDYVGSTESTATWVYFVNRLPINVGSPAFGFYGVKFSDTFFAGATKVERGTQFQDVGKYTQPDNIHPDVQYAGMYATNQQLHNGNLEEGVPTLGKYYSRFQPEVVIPEQPDPSTFTWFYSYQEPLTNLKKVEQKAFNLDRYYLLEAKDSFDGVCNIILKINWNFSLNTLPLNQISQEQYCSFFASGSVSIHDSYIQNKPILDGPYIHEFSHFNLDIPNISYSNSEKINNGRFFYNFNDSINVKAIYKTISVVSGASVTSIKNFDLNIPVYENFTFK